MTRRRRLGKPANKSGLDTIQLNNAVHTLAQCEVVATVLPGTMTQRLAYELLIPQAARDALKAAEPYMVPDGYGYSGDTVNQPIGYGVQLQFKKDSIGMPLHRSLPKNDTLSTPAELLAQTDYRHLVPLLKLRDQVLEIHKKWAVVQHVIMYLDATNNAKTIRWLLPAIKTLKGAEAIPDEIDPRVAPPSMGVMLPLVREAGVTLSAAQFLPKAEPRPLGKLIFYCTDTTAFPHNNVKVVPPLATYEL